MAVLSHALHWKGATGSVTVAPGKPPQPTYTAVYKVQTNSPLDQAGTVIKYFLDTAGLPKPGDAYAYAHDYDPLARLKSITPERATGSAYLWYVALGYSPKDETKDGGKPDANGNLTNDPLKWVEEITVSESYVSEPVRKAKYLGGGKGKFHAAATAKPWRPVTNSAFTPLVPGLEKQVSIRNWSFTKNTAQHDDQLLGTYITAINKDVVVIIKGAPYNLFAVWQKHQAKVTGISVSYHWEPSGFYWRRTLNIALHPVDWDVEVFDEGKQQSAKEGDPDGRGGYYSSTDMIPGVPTLRQNAGPDDVPITDPLPLDGDGHLKSDEEPVVYLKWQIEKEMDFSVFGL